MTSITRTLTLSLSVAATAIFLVLLSIVIWLDVTRERELTFCQAAAAILDRATVVDPGRGLIIRSSEGLEELKSASPDLWYVVSYDGLMTEFGRELRPALPFSLPYTGPIGFSVLNTLDQKSTFCLAVVRRGASELVMMIGGAQVRLDQIAKSFVLRNFFSSLRAGHRLRVDRRGRRVPVRALRGPQHRTRDEAGARNRADGTAGVDFAR